MFSIPDRRAKTALCATLVTAMALTVIAAPSPALAQGAGGQQTAGNTPGTPGTSGGSDTTGANGSSGAAQLSGSNAPRTNQDGPTQPLPTSVLLYPVIITGDNGAVVPETPATREVQSIVTDALRKYLQKGGVGVVVYSNRLPSIERSVTEGSIKKEDATKGPGDNANRAQQFAQIVGASEYITASVENYKYDTASRRATFNLSLFRNAVEGQPLGTSAERAVGEAPADVSAPRQEGSAVARAAEVVAQQAVLGIYPQSAVLLNPPAKKQVRRKRSPLGFIIPAAALGIFLIAPR